MSRWGEGIGQMAQEQGQDQGTRIWTHTSYAECCPLGVLPGSVHPLLPKTAQGCPFLQSHPEVRTLMPAARSCPSQALILLSPHLSLQELQTLEYHRDGQNKGNGLAPLDTGRMPPPVKADPAVRPAPSGLWLPTVEVPTCLAVQSCLGFPSSSPCRRGSQLSPKALCPAFSTRPLHPWQSFIKTDAFQERQSSLGRRRAAIPGCPQEPDWRGRGASRPPMLVYSPPCGPLEGLVGSGQGRTFRELTSCPWHGAAQFYFFSCFTDTCY